MIIGRDYWQFVQEAPLLPEGERYELPPGKGQFRLISLFILLTVGSLVAAFGHWTELEIFEVVILELFVLTFWWTTAQLREESEPKARTDQSALREEVKRWLQERDGSTRIRR